jgi:hypothetical protein
MSSADRRGQAREEDMRSFLPVAAAILAFAGTMTFASTDADAAVCADGVVENGVKVRRCI